MRFPSVCFVTHPDKPSGVDYWRALLPARSLHAIGGRVGVVPLGRDLPAFDGGFPNVVVMNQRASGAIGRTRHLRETLFEPNEVLYVADVCDDPEAFADTPLRQRLKRIRQGPAKGSTVSDLVLDHISDVHLVTVNSAEMAKVCRRYNQHVEVLPDLIEPDLWLAPKPPQKPPGLVVGVAGGDTHKHDWRILAPVWTRLAETYDWLSFAVVGHPQQYLADAVPANRFYYIPWAEIDQYTKNYRWIDIGCAPVLPTRFNKSKSPIRWLEHSIAGAITIGSHFLYGGYIEDGVTGYLATTEEQWYAKIVEAIDFPRVRAAIIKRARETVRDEWSHNRATATHRLNVYKGHWGRVYGRQRLIAAESIGSESVRGAVAAILSGRK